MCCRLVPRYLPAPLTNFVGREQDLSALEELLGEARLVTLTGTGGVGKTRLALELAVCAVGWFPDGAWLADLAGITRAELVASRVMEALGVWQDGDIPVPEALVDRLRSAELLLVLDNCEHLLDACAELAGALLGGSPRLRVLATSREPLGVPGEVVYPVPPLAVPPDRADQQAISRAPAVRLFLDRGSAARAGPPAEAIPVDVVARICRELDGLPLAIELAAARTSALSVEEVEAHLGDKFGFLRYRRPVGDPRHQTLKTAIDWSHDRLPAGERRVFRELSVFAGGFGLPPAATVCCGGDQAATLDLIDRLVAKSLIGARPVPGGTRYQMLETVRQYAAGRLADAGDNYPAMSRHATAFLRLAERERDLHVLAREHDNFRAALDWCLSEGHQDGPRLAAALGNFWLARGFLREGRDWLERALAQSGAQGAQRAELIRPLGAVLFVTGELHQAESVLSEGLRLAQQGGAPGVHARIRLLLAELRCLQGGSVGEGLAECEAAAAALESKGDLHGLAEAWMTIGTLRFYRGESPADEQALERAVACGQESGNYRARLMASAWLAMVLTTLRVPADAAIGRVEQVLQDVAGEPRPEAEILLQLACLYAYGGRLADARAAKKRGQAMLTAMGAKYRLAIGAVHAGTVELIAENYPAAERELRPGYEVLQAMGDQAHLANTAAVLAETAYAQGHLDQAQELTAQAEALARPSDIEPQARWRITAAKLLARRGQFSAARHLIEEAEALVPPSWAAHLGPVLVAKAEVSQLAGARHDAERHLLAALRIYQERRAPALADRTQAKLRNLSAMHR
jgi:predicted ATPase